MPEPLGTTIPDDISWLIYGAPGEGKTNTLGTLAKLGKVEILSFDPNRLNTIVGVPDIYADYFQTRDMEKEASPLFTKVHDTLDKLLSLNPYPYIATCLDSYTFLADIIQGHILTLTGRWEIFKNPKFVGMKGVEPGFRRGDYGPHADLSENIIRKFLSLPGYKIMTSHGRVVTDDERNILLFLPASFGQGFPQTLPGFFNEMYRCKVKTGTEKTKPTYELQTRSDSQWGAKSGLNVYNKVLRKNEPVLDMYEPADLADIITKYQTARKKAGYAN